MTEYAVSDSWDESVRYTTSEASSAAESIALKVLDGDSYGIGARIDDLHGSGLNAAAKSFTVGAHDEPAVFSAKPFVESVFAPRGLDSFNSDSMFSGGFSSFGADAGVVDHEDEWAAQDQYLTERLSGLGLASDEFHGFRARPNGVSLVEEEPTVPPTVSRSFLPTSYGAVDDTGISPQTGSTYGDFLGYSGAVYEDGTKQSISSRSARVSQQASGWAAHPSFEHVSPTNASSAAPERYSSPMNGGGAPHARPSQFHFGEYESHSFQQQHHASSNGQGRPTIGYSQLRRNVTVDTQLLQPQIEPPVQIHRSVSLDQLGADDYHHAWGSHLQQQHQQHQQHQHQHLHSHPLQSLPQHQHQHQLHSPHHHQPQQLHSPHHHQPQQQPQQSPPHQSQQQHAPSIRLATSVPFSQSGSSSGYNPPMRPPALHLGATQAYSPINTFNLPSPRQGRAHSPTYAAGVRHVHGYHSPRNTSPRSPTTAAAAAAAAGAAQFVMVPNVGVRVPTTVLFPGVGYRVVDMVVSPPAVPFGGVLRRSPYDGMVGSPTAAQDSARHSRGKEVRRDSDTKDILAESSDGYVYQVQFKRAHRNFILGPTAPRDIKTGEYVKVEADRGEDLGMVIGKVAASDFADDKHTAGFKSRGFTYHQNEAKRIIRIATTEEQNQLPIKALEEEKVLQVCREKVENRNLPMKVIDAEYQFDRHKLTFFFEADRRIDFRELVRDLFALYKTRIWMQQVDAGSSEKSAELGRLSEQTDFVRDSLDDGSTQERPSLGLSLEQGEDRRSSFDQPRP